MAQAGPLRRFRSGGQHHWPGPDNLFAHHPSPAPSRRSHWDASADALKRDELCVEECVVILEALGEHAIWPENQGWQARGDVSIPAKVLLAPDQPIHVCGVS